jgi:hypothetical protein
VRTPGSTREDSSLVSLLTIARTGVSLSSAFGTPLSANNGEVEGDYAETVSA